MGILCADIMCNHSAPILYASSAGFSSLRFPGLLQESRQLRGTSAL